MKLKQNSVVARKMAGNTSIHGPLSISCAPSLTSAPQEVIGYFGGRLDQLMMRIVDVLYGLPFMFLVILLMALFTRSLVLLFVAIGAINWLDMKGNPYSTSTMRIMSWSNRPPK